MNAAIEVERILKEHNATLVRQNKHLVYRLPNGQSFVLAKTSSDPDRAARNSLSDLKRALGIVRETSKAKGVSDMQIEQTLEEVLPASPEALEVPRTEVLKERIETAIAGEEAVQEKLLAEAQAVERKVHMLKALLPFADDPAAEGALRAVLPNIEPSDPPAAQAMAHPEPPQQITERVQVTRQLVFAATQTFDDTFTVNDVMTLMTGGRKIDGAERLRVRSSIAGSMMALLDRGELIRVVEGYGKRQAIWRKAAMNGKGEDAGTRA